MAFRFTPLDLEEVILIEPDTHEDERGFFRETFRRSAFARAGIDRAFVQANVSRSRARVLRGLHFQREPAGIGKLVSVPRGRILDVAADVRPSSLTFGRSVSAELSAADGRMLYVPEGFAHGVYAFEDDTLISYLITGEYSPQHDAGVRWDDPDIAIAWPDPEPILSARDRALPTLRELHPGTIVHHAAEEATR